MNEAEVRQLSDEALEALRVVVVSEVERRYRVESIPVLVDESTRRFLTDVGREQGAAWVQPTGAHDAYPQGWQVAHNGTTWESLTPANVWEPGVSGWRELVEPGGDPAAWVQPTGAHDAYPQGARVAHNGQTWTSDIDANVWEPGVYGWTAD